MYWKSGPTTILENMTNIIGFMVSYFHLCTSENYERHIMTFIAFNFKGYLKSSKKSCKNVDFWQEFQMFVWFMYWLVNLKKIIIYICIPLAQLSNMVGYTGFRWPFLTSSLWISCLWVYLENNKRYPCQISQVDWSYLRR